MKRKQLMEALEYLNYCISEGVGIDLEDKTDKEIIDMANHMKDIADKDEQFMLDRMAEAEEVS